MPDAIELVTLDLSYLSLARAVPELERLQLMPTADSVALVKPMFELALGEPPSDPAEIGAGCSTSPAKRSPGGPWSVVASHRVPVSPAPTAPSSTSSTP